MNSTGQTKVPGRVLAWTALLVALGASVLANVAYARAELGPRLSAGTAPVLTVLAAGLIERVPLSTARVWQRWLAWLGLGAVAAAAFITSYEHQYGLLLAYGNPYLSAVLLPVAVDGLIVLASVCLAVIAERRRAVEVEPVDERPAVAEVAHADPVPAAPAVALAGRQVEPEDALTAAARSVARELAAAGRKVSRDVLAAELRKRGHRIGTDRAAILARSLAGA